MTNERRKYALHISKNMVNIAVRIAMVRRSRLSCSALKMH